MFFKKLYLLLIICTVSGCVRFEEIHYVYDHPDFSPLLTKSGVYEYQFVLFQSSPEKLLHIKTYLTQDEYLEDKKAYIAYSDSNFHIKKLKVVEISLDDWHKIFEKINASSLWTMDDKCMQQGYRQRKLTLEYKGECAADIAITGGTTFSFAGSEPDRSQGILLYCGGDNTCGGLSQIPELLLDIARK